MPKRKRSDSKRSCLVHWFRKGLRLHDNPALRDGLLTPGITKWRCVYFLDPWFAGQSNRGINKWRFLLQSLEDLDSSLRKLNSRLFVIRGQPADVLPRLFKDWEVSHLSFEEDCEPYGRERDMAIRTLAKEAHVSVVVRRSHTLYNPQDIIKANDGQFMLTYQRFQNVLQGQPLPEHPVDPISFDLIENICSGIGSNHDDRYGVPTLEELGFDTDDIPPVTWVGGETEAKMRLERHLERKAWVANFEKPKMTPQSLVNTNTGLSPYLRFGCLSPRVFYWKLTELYRKVKKKQNPPMSLHGQLLWREFFYTAATNNSNFDRMIDNPICVQIPWDKNHQYVYKWAEAKTGFPWIDAIMTQLKQEGWIHNLLRHATVCFLTRGNLWISWEDGMKIFDEYLLDADWSVNAGMWMWLSCSSFFQQFFHCYCPVGFGKRTDPSGDYIRRYLPILKNIPTKYIYEPWLAPKEVQQAAKCIIGEDYPFPMIDHAETGRTNIERMKQVYQKLSKYGGPGLLASVPSSKAATVGPQPPSQMFTSTVSQCAASNDIQIAPSTSTQANQQGDITDKAMKSFSSS
ncbi:cryptochrome-1-like [Ptychodera flava]|uniref:cryptochrome-1-like n=1 Tax=Ptychodera flava TaxID=63121 RepID=UPI00396A9E60